MNIGREHHFVGLHEKARGLQPQQKVLARDDLKRALAHFGPISDGPGADFPSRQIFGHLKGHARFSV